MHPVLASTTAAVSFLFLVLYALALKPVYEAEAVLYEQPEAVKLFGETAASSFDSGRYDSFLQEQIQTLQRPDTISEALAQLPRSTWTEYGSSPDTAAQSVLTRLKVARVTTSYQVALTLKGSDPKNVTEVVNAIAQTYLKLVHQQTRSEIDERATILAEERLHVASELRKAQQEQTTLSASLGVANPNGEGDPYEVELAALREQMVQARGAHDAVAAQLTSLGAQGQPHGPALTAAADDIILGDAGLASLKSSVNQRRATLRGQMAGMTADNPLRQRDQEELAELDHSLEEMSATLRAKAERDLQEKLRSDLQRTADVQGRIQMQLAHRTAAATSSTPKLQRAAELNTDLKRLLLRQAEIDDALRGLQLEESSPGAARLALAAQVPTAPEASRKRMVLLASLPVALLFGTFAAAVARKRDQTIYSGADVETVLGFPPMASLPTRSDGTNLSLEQDILRLAGSIETSCRTSGIRTFLLTGVSSQADIEPLSYMLLEKLRQLGVQAYKITSSALLLPGHPDGTLKADAENPSKAQPCAPCTADKHGFVNENLRLLLARHTLILIEAAPLVDSAEAEYVARCADATILVAQYELTTRTELSHAANLLQRLQVPGVGVVLQGVWKRYLRDEAISSSTSSPESSIAAVHRFRRSDRSDLGTTRTTAPSDKTETREKTSSANQDSGPAEDSSNHLKEHASFASSQVTESLPTGAASVESAEDQLQSARLEAPDVQAPKPHFQPLAKHSTYQNTLEATELVNVEGPAKPSGTLVSMPSEKAAVHRDNVRPELKKQETLDSREAQTDSRKSIKEQTPRSPISPTTNKRWDPIPPLRSAELNARHRPDDVDNSDTEWQYPDEIQSQTSRGEVSDLQSDKTAQQEGTLIRHWALLSRFQQANHLLPAARSAQPDQEVRPRTAHV